MRTSTKVSLLTGVTALAAGRLRRRPAASPATGRVVDPASLPRPKLYAEPRPGQQPVAFSGLEEQESNAGPGSVPAFVAVAVMILGVVLVAAFVLTMSWPLLAAGLVVGAIGVVLALKARIMQDVSVTDSPHGSG